MPSICTSPAKQQNSPQHIPIVPAAALAQPHHGGAATHAAEEILARDTIDSNNTSPDVADMFFYTMAGASILSGIGHMLIPFLLGMPSLVILYGAMHTLHLLLLAFIPRLLSNNI